jgi:hypothetical protein
MGYVSDEERRELLAAVDYTRVDLRDGMYIARTSAVDARLKVQSKRAMIKVIAEDYWPDLIADGSWTKEYLRTLPAYVLAVILCQDDDAPSHAGQVRILNGRIQDKTPYTRG